MSNFKRFLKEYIFEHKFKYICIFILIISQSIITMLIPAANTVLIDNALVNRDELMFIIYLGIMIGSYILNYIIGFTKDFMLVNVSETITCELRNKINEKICRISLKFFQKNSFSDVISKYEKEVGIIENSCGYMIIETLGNLVTIIIVLGIMLSINIPITLISLIMVGFYCLNYKYWGKKIKITTEENMEYNSQVIDSINENYNNVSVTKLYNAYDYSIGKFRERYNVFKKSNIKLNKQYLINTNSSSVILVLGVCAVWLIGGYAILAEKMSLGTLIAIISYQSMLLAPIRFFSEFNNSYQGTVTALKRIYSILDYEEEHLGTKTLTGKINKIEFKDVSFSYDGNKVLEHVDAEFKSGEIAAVVGLSGTGKSTIARLITALSNVDSGEIYINDISINELDINSLRSNISLITQDSLFFRDSIMENIKLSGNKDMNQINELSEKLDLLDDIKELPEGWNSLLSTGASNLSGGQKKRLDLLRGLLKKSSVIIFDESTACLDEIRREKVFRLIKELKKDSLIIFISHNLNELKHVDKVYVLENYKLTDISIVDTDDSYINMIKKELQYA